MHLSFLLLSLPLITAQMTNNVTIDPADPASSNGPGTAAGGNGTSNNGGVGDLIFDQPSEKPVKPEILRAGSPYTIKWRVSPKSMTAGNITIEYRRGRWPNVGKWMVIAEGVSGTSYDWTVPENEAPDYYIFRITPKDEGTGVRARTSQPFQVFQARNPADLLNSGYRTSIGIFAFLIGICIMLV
jgi:hypothetical protein